MLNDNTILSFILPCYNVSSYIGACLDSLLVQDIPHEEYEIICVNDCSIDNTRDIIQSYQKKYPNIRLIDHALNSKSGPSRNTGMENARGRYVWFVDADDMIKPHILSYLLGVCEKDELDELFFNFDAINDACEVIHESQKFENSKVVLSGLEFVHRFFSGRLSDISIIWHQIYRRDFLVDNHFRFPETNMGEDGPFAWRTVLNAKRVKSVSDVCYRYRHNDRSMTAEIKVKPNPVMLFEKSFIFGKEVIQLAEEMGKTDKQIALELKNIAKWHINSFKEPLLDNYSKTDLKKFFQYAQEHLSVVKYSFSIIDKSNRGFVKSLERGWLCFGCWWIRENCKRKIKSIRSNR